MIRPLQQRRELEVPITIGPKRFPPIESPQNSPRSNHRRIPPPIESPQNSPQPNHRRIRPKGAKQGSPGQSAAPPWVPDRLAMSALKGRNKARREHGLCFALAGIGIEVMGTAGAEGVDYNWPQGGRHGFTPIESPQNSPQSNHRKIHPNRITA